MSEDDILLALERDSAERTARVRQILGDIILRVPTDERGRAK